MKEAIADILEKPLKKLKLKLSREEIKSLIEIPPNSEMGDYAFPCFVLANQYKQMPHEVALQLRQEIGDSAVGFLDVQTAGPYLNFFVNRIALALELIDQVKNEKENYGRNFQEFWNSIMKKLSVQISTTIEEFTFANPWQLIKNTEEKETLQEK